jgi:hypothetical protein
MKTISASLYRQVAVGLVLLLTVQFAMTAAAQEVPATPQPTSAPIQNPASANPAADAPQIASLPDSPVPIAPQTAPTASQENSPQTPPQQNAPPQSLGTAAAPSQPASGVAASRPAGAAIAPARQKRSRTFAIRIALIVGAAVAIGTVVALSSASPSRP